MKTFKTIFVLLTFSFLVISCSSDNNEPEAVVYNEENPFEIYMAYSGFSGSTGNVVNSGIYEFGFSFKPTVTGKINSLIVKLPTTNDALRVTLWDVETKKVIKSEMIKVPTAYVTVEKSIASIALTKDKEYFISINSDDWFSRNKKDGSAAPYPIIAGNITITGFAYVSSTATETIFPTNIRDKFYFGDVTFKFQQTE